MEDHDSETMSEAQKHNKKYNIKIIQATMRKRQNQNKKKMYAKYNVFNCKNVCDNS